MIYRYFAITANTFVETMRQPIYGVILAATAVMMALNVSLSAFTLDNDDKLLLDLGLSTLLLSGLFLAVFSAAGVLSREIENKTVLTVISKPIGRPTFVLGKFTGLLAAQLVAFYLSCLVLILTLRHGVMDHTTDPWDAPVLVFGLGAVFAAIVVGGFCNFFYNLNFPTTTVALLAPLLTLAVVAVGFFDKEFTRIPWGQDFVGGQVLMAAYLVFLFVAVLAAFALAASTRLGQTATLILSLAFLALGTISDYAFGRHGIQAHLDEIEASATMPKEDADRVTEAITGKKEGSTLAEGVYRIVPNVGPFWVIDGLHAGMQQTTITSGYLGRVSAYAGLLIVGMLGIAVAAFQRREIG